MLKFTLLLSGLLILTACSTTRPVLNTPVNTVLPTNGEAVGSAVRSNDLALILTFSGGGTRASAFSYGVLKGLRDVNIQASSGSTYRLLDEVDLISSVSGGSFTAAYYGLYGDAIFEDYEDRFLKHPVQTNLLIDWLLKPVNWIKLFPGFYNRTDLAAEYYEKNIFGSKTFADLPEDAPQVVINATDLSAGLAFSFTTDDFQWICSDLGSYPIGRAVAASAAVPVIFSPITLENHSGCEYPEEINARQAASRNDELALGNRKYQNKDQYPFLHLVDGGISDNLGIRSLLHVISENNNNFWDVLSRFNMKQTQDVVFIVVNASDNIPAEIALTSEEPDTSLTLAAMTTIQFNRYNSDTLDILESEFEHWSDQVKSGRCQEHESEQCDLIRFHLIELDFSQLPQAEFQELGRVETSLELLPAQVDKLINAGEKLLKTSPHLQQLIHRLNIR